MTGRLIGRTSDFESENGGSSPPWSAKKGERKMKKLFLVLLLLAFVIPFPTESNAQVSVQIGIGLPPIIPVFPGVVLLPNTSVYAVPDIEDREVYFYAGFWWCFWHGYWYQSIDCRRGWSRFNGIPGFHRRIPPGWRHDYHNNRWQGQPWRHEQIHPSRVQDMDIRHQYERSKGSQVWQKPGRGPGQPQLGGQGRGRGPSQGRGWGQGQSR